MSSKLIESMTATSFVAILTTLSALSASGYFIKLIGNQSLEAANVTVFEILDVMEAVQHNSTSVFAVQLPPNSYISFSGELLVVNLNGNVASIRVNGLSGEFIIDHSGTYSLQTGPSGLVVVKLG